MLNKSMEQRRNRSKPKVLVEAYECSPAQSHVPGSAWQILTRLSRWYDLWIITEETQYADEVSSFLKKTPDLSDRMRFSFIPRLKPGGWGRKRPALPMREILEYRKWLKQSYKIAKTLNSKNRFDLVHHLRGNTFREPGFLWKLPVPFVWGPTGGTTCVPWRMFSALDVKGRIEHALRNVITAYQFRFSSTVRNACRTAACIMAQTGTDQKNFHKVYGVKSIIVHEQASEPSIGKCRTYDGTRKLNIAWIGQCIARKAMPLLLRTVSRPEIKERVNLHIAGDGPYRAKWQKMAHKIGVADLCKWYGWIGQQETLEVLQSSDVFVSTSLLEGTPATVMQALSLGVPVICLKHCGFEDIVTEQCGFPITVKSPRNAINKFASAINFLIRRPQELKRLSQGAIQQAEIYSWDKLAGEIRAVYEKALVSGVAVPNHEMLPLCYQKIRSVME